jgi:two-component system, chemotaxis family, protein-glutamate methylesterase/glutaminase
MEAPMIPDTCRLDRPTSISCPDCGGVMARDGGGPTTLYRCHIGHTLTIEALLHAMHRVLEERLEACLAVLNERAELCRLMSEAAEREGRDGSEFDASRAQSLEQAKVVSSLLESDWGHPEEGNRRIHVER